jgi:hypothetical protein
MQMNKVRELLERRPSVVYASELGDALAEAEKEWSEAITFRNIQLNVAIGRALRAEAKLRNDGVDYLNPKTSEKDARITEHVKRIAELEAELAKRKYPPPLPDSVLSEHIAYLREIVSPAQWACDLLAWVDTHYPKPKTQAELDAEHLERLARDHDHYNPNELRSIATRIREANNANGK